jgi:hypothetical protein
MAKSNSRSRDVRAGEASAMVRPPVVVPPEISATPTPGMEAEAGGPIYIWRTRVLCPHCQQSYDSDVIGTKGPIRYRRCRRPSCHRTFKDQAETGGFPVSGK